MRVSLDHVHIFCSNLAATVEFFCTMLDATVVWDDQAAGVRNVRLALGNAFLQLYDQPPKAPRGGAVHHLGIETDDLAALVSRMKGHFRLPVLPPPFMPMPSSETLERFIALLEQNAHVEAVEAFYTADASMQENQAEPRKGRESHVANERRVLSKARFLVSRCVRPVFVRGDNVVIRWIFRFEWLDGTVTQMEQLAYQRWEGEHISVKTFFYDLAQLVPRKASV